MNYKPLIIKDGFIQRLGDNDSVDTNKIQFIHTQVIPSLNWVITHNLNSFPSVIIADSSGTVVEGLKTYVTKNIVSLVFSAPFSGKAYFVA